MREEFVIGEACVQHGPSGAISRKASAARASVRGSHGSPAIGAAQQSGGIEPFRQGFHALHRELRRILDAPRREPLRERVDRLDLWLLREFRGVEDAIGVDDLLHAIEELDLAEITRPRRAASARRGALCGRLKKTSVTSPVSSPTTTRLGARLRPGRGRAMRLDDALEGGMPSLGVSAMDG